MSTEQWTSWKIINLNTKTHSLIHCGPLIITRCKHEPNIFEELLLIILKCAIMKGLALPWWVRGGEYVLRLNSAHQHVYSLHLLLHKEVKIRIQFVSIGNITVARFLLKCLENLIDKEYQVLMSFVIHKKLKNIGSYLVHLLPLLFLFLRPFFLPNAPIHTKLV